MVIKYRSKETDKTGKCYSLIVDQDRKIFDTKDKLRYDVRIDTYFDDMKRLKHWLKFQGYKDISNVTSLNDLVRLNGDSIVHIPKIKEGRKYEIPFVYNHRYGDIVDIEGYYCYVIDVGAEV